MAKTSQTEEVRWLDPVEMDAWLQLVGILIRLPPALDAQVRRDAGLTHFEYETLAVLSEAPRRTLRMSSLAALANGSMSRLSHVVSRLEDKGWVRRTPCPEDRRATNAILTPAGYRQVVAAAPGYVTNVRRLVIDPLTRSQLRQLSDIGRRWHAALDPDSSQDAPWWRQG